MPSSNFPLRQLSQELISHNWSFQCWDPDLAYLCLIWAWIKLLSQRKIQTFFLPEHLTVVSICSFPNYLVQILFSRIFYHDRADALINHLHRVSSQNCWVQIWIFLRLCQTEQSVFYDAFFEWPVCLQKRNQDVRWEGCDRWLRVA